MRSPDLSGRGYDIERLLGQNAEGGRATWLGRQISTGQRVVLKEFSFAARQASWAGLAGHEREVAVLRELDHPRIPRYLDAFETTDGFYLVQAYVDAPHLGGRRTFDADEVEGVAISLLEILTYLQARVPPVIHRDIKPDNILLARDGQVHLVDFGLARSERERSSTMAAGTPGFMPPEQILGRELTRATDLYGVGATVIKLLTGLDTDRVSELVDASFRFDLDRLPRSVSGGFRRWLSRMVAPDQRERFASAEAALAALHGAEEEPEEDVFRAATSEDEPTPIPSQGYTAAPVPVPEPQRRTRRGLTTLMMLIMVGGGGFAMYATMMTSYSPEVAEADDLEAGRTFTCSSKLTLSNETHAVPDGIAIRARPGCDLTLNNCTVRGETAIYIDTGGHVALDNTRLEATQTAVGLYATSGLSLEVRGSTLVSDGHVLRISDAADAVVATSELRGVIYKQAGTLALRDTTVTSRTVAIVNHGGVTTVDGGRITGQKAAIQAYGGEVTIVDKDRTTLSGDVMSAGDGLVLGIGGDDEGALRKRLADRLERYGRVACSPVTSCIFSGGVDGEVKLVVTARAKAAAKDWAATFDGQGLTDTDRACVQRRFHLLSIPSFVGPVGTLVCSVDGRAESGIFKGNAVGSYVPDP